jgi:hypothetical protein
VKISHHIDFLIALLIVIIAVVFSLLIYNHTIRLSLLVGPFRFSHWLSIIGTIGIAVATPLFTIFKRSFLPSYIKIVRFHIFGTGLAMFIAMSLQIILGFTQRFRSQRLLYKKLINPRANRFIHAGLVMVFYTVILFHVLHGLEII